MKNIGNWLGGEAVYNSNIPSGSVPGYVNISTSDAVVHGQAKQRGRFAFARVYESGHEVPYYQPLTALTVFERAINGHDIATGKHRVDRAYVTVGPAESTYREGNATVKFLLVENGQETIVNATTYDVAVDGQSAPARKLLAELEPVGKLPMANATAYGNASEELKGSGKEKEPIHLRKREGAIRRGGLVPDGVTGVEGDAFVPRGLDDLRV